MIDFRAVNDAALANARAIIPAIIPGGKFRSLEYVVRNPRRADQHPGSFTINYRTGVWKDFATGDGGGDLISLVAFVNNCSQGDAARELANGLDVPLSKPNGHAAIGHHQNGAASHPPSLGVTASRGSSNQVPKLYHFGDEGPPSSDRELRRHTYKREGVPAAIKIKLKDGGYTQWYRVPQGWQQKKPDDYQPIPYVAVGLDPFDSEYDQLLWPEGEKDVDGPLNLPAFTFGGVGDGLPDGVAHYLTGRHLVILADNDDPGRVHAEKKAVVAQAAGAASIKIVHFPELPQKGDVADFIANGGTLDELNARIDAAPIWQAPTTSNDVTCATPSEERNFDKEIARLASLSEVQYEHERRPAADRLGIRTTALDRAVKDARPADTKGQGRAFEMPAIERWDEPVDGAAMLDEVCAAISSYVIMPAESVPTLALWAVHTHCFDCFGHSPRAAITSPEKGCGKTTTLDVLAALVARPLSTANASVSAIFRIIEMASPTLLIDEADTFLKENDELRGILNSGHRRGGQVLRTVGEDYEPKQFSTWAPAAIAMIGRLPDTLNDRSVIISLRRRKPTERIQSFRGDQVQHLTTLAQKIARWVWDHQIELRSADPDTGELLNRTADNWRPLFAIADVVGGAWPDRVREAANIAVVKSDEQSLGVQLLTDMKWIFDGCPEPCSTAHESDRVSSADAVNHLIKIDGRPWAEYKGGKPITANTLARLLGQYNIQSQTIRLVSGTTAKGYYRSTFEDAFTAYLSPESVTPSQPNNDGACYVFQNVTPKKPVTLCKTSQPNNDGHCDGVTLSIPSHGELGDFR